MSDDTKNVIHISKEIKRRRDVLRARDSEEWRQVEASFALSGIELNDRHAEIVGQILDGEISVQDAIKNLTSGLR
ncbi:MAG: hypothetical protein ACM34A_01710 [Bacillota bacterium]